MPKSHRAHAEWSPKRLIQWGESIGAHTGAIVEHLLRSKPHPEQGYRACLGLLALARQGVFTVNPRFTQALAWLKCGADSGFFNDRAMREHARKDPDLSILGRRPEFQTLIEPLAK